MIQKINVIDLNNLDINDTNLDLSATIGAFDGIHLGHKKLIESLDKNKCAFTFDTHPDFLLNKRCDNGYINTLDEKIEILLSLGIEYIFIIPRDILKLSYDKFNLVLKRLNVKKISVGSDFRYGAGALGSYKTLKSFDLTVVPFLTYENEKISSSFLRKELEQGNIELVNSLLVRPFSVSGKIIHGHEVGKTLGFRTANLMNNKYGNLRKGVYKAIATIDNKDYLAICNYGINPTINTIDSPRFEIHIINFDELIYDKEIKLTLLCFIRDEVKFNNQDELIKQIKKDIEVVIK